MKHIEYSSMQKLQKSFPVSSLIWAAIVTAIVLALAASANAQEESASASEPTTDNVRPLPRTAPLMPKATSSVPRNIDRPLTANASGTPPIMNATLRRETASGMAAEKMAELEQRRATIMEEVEARRASLTEKRALIASSTVARRAILKEEVQKRIVDRASGLTTAVLKAITNLEGMVDRLRAHAEKLSENSVDVSAALALLDEADQLLASAKETLEGVDTNISYATLSETPQADWSDAKEQFAAVRSILTDVRELLREALASLKAAVPPATDSDTSTN